VPVNITFHICFLQLILRIVQLCEFIFGFGLVKGLEAEEAIAPPFAAPRALPCLHLVQGLQTN
jgi:hypothetical protein